ncbi:MAG: Ldh family oxidoreductase [Burkholderiaceae bacterium]
MKLSATQLRGLCSEAFGRRGVSPMQTIATVDALILAEAQGLASHGISRVPMYLAHVAHGRVDPKAEPVVMRQTASAALVDAANGFAFPACEMAVNSAIEKARDTGIAIGAVTNSHHFGVAGNHLMAMADAGLVGLAMGNSPAAMPAWGGKQAIFGTNPIAAIFPRQDSTPILVDLSLSEVARGKIMVAAKNGTPIPEGWALDAQGKPTTDAKAALTGMMLPMGGVKGAMLAMTVELLVTALTGAQFGAEADSFFVDAGNQPKLGQAFIAINPDALAGRLVYESRLNALVKAMLNDAEVRLPGTRRFHLADQAMESGFDLPDALIAQIQAIA